MFPDSCLLNISIGMESTCFIFFTSGPFDPITSYYSSHTCNELLSIGVADVKPVGKVKVDSFSSYYNY